MSFASRRTFSLQQTPRYERRPNGSLPDPFKADIVEMLGDDAKVPATVILDHLRARLRGPHHDPHYLSKERPRYLARRRFQRTSYIPGEIGQFDWWDVPIAIPVGKNRVRKPHGLVATLPNSAAHQTEFTFSRTMATSARR